MDHLQHHHYKLPPPRQYTNPNAKHGRRILYVSCTSSPSPLTRHRQQRRRLLLDRRRMQRRHHLRLSSTTPAARRPAVPRHHGFKQLPTPRNEVLCRPISTRRDGHLQPEPGARLRHVRDQRQAGRRDESQHDWRNRSHHGDDSGVD